MLSARSVVRLPERLTATSSVTLPVEVPEITGTSLVRGCHGDAASGGVEETAVKEW